MFVKPEFHSKHHHFGPKAYASMIDALWNDQLHTHSPLDGHFVPGADVHESDSAYHLRVSLPGFDKENIKVDLKEDHLIVTAERKDETPENVKTHLRELKIGKFVRSFRVPKSIDKTKIVAEYKNGILNLEVPKTETSTIIQTIEVK